MANGHRRGSRGDETRVAPEEDEGATGELPPDFSEDTADIPLPPPEETRMAPLETRADETRMGPAQGRGARASGSRGVPPARDAAHIVTDARDQAHIVTEARERDQALIVTDVTGHNAGAAAKLKGAGPAGTGTGWLAKSGGPGKGATGTGRSVSAGDTGKGARGGSPAPAGVVRMSPLEPAGAKAAAQEDGPALRTMFANHSALLAEQLREALAKKMYGRGPHRVLRIDEPEGPSTAGGKLARQPISLVPRKGSGPSIVCGWVDVSKREAQLRNHEAVAKRYESQHGEPLELQPEEYERFLHDVEEVLTKALIKVRIIVPDESPGARALAPAVQARGRGVSPGVVFVLVTLAFVLGLLAGRMAG